ncbi:MAG: hypothetical protein EHM45_13355 [Desulfobacteraceae bacterium]|nr:MAG: hypothetical protein EHM45_13355 [Desulfobacteraceae bacterium]
MLKKVMVFFGVLAVMMPLTLMLSAEEGIKTVKAVGVADGNSAQARDEALNDALRKAVEQGVGTFVSAELTVEQEQLVEDKIYTASSGYIENYKIDREGPKGNQYQVEITAQVKLGKLSNDLKSIGVLMEKKRYPRTAVLVYSKEIDTTFPGVSLEGNNSVENWVEKSLLDKDFQLVDLAQVGYKKEMETSLSAGDPNKAAKIAKNFGAEVLVAGDVRRSFVGERQVMGRSMRFFTNEVRLKAIETDTTRVLYSGARTKPASGAESFGPLEMATQELMKEMSAAILEKWRKDVYQASAYQIDIENISFENLAKFKEGLKKIRGVRDVQTRHFQAQNALLEVQYQGSLEELSDKILKTIKAPRFAVQGMQANTLEIKCQ